MKELTIIIENYADPRAVLLQIATKLTEGYVGGNEFDHSWEIEEQSGAECS